MLEEYPDDFCQRISILTLENQALHKEVQELNLRKTKWLQVQFLTSVVASMDWFNLQNMTSRHLLNMNGLLSM